MKKYGKYFGLLVFVITLFFGCSGTNQEKNKDDGYQQQQLKKKNLDGYSKNLARSHFIDGATLEQNYAYEKAALEYQEALLYDDAPGIHYSLGKVFTRLKKYALASIHLRRAVEQDSTNLEFKNFLAQLLSFTLQEKEAINIYNEIIKTDSTYIDSYIDLAQLYINSEPQKASEILEKLIMINGEEISIYILLVEAYNRSANYNKATEVIEKILFLAPGNIDIKKTLVNSYILSGKATEAESLMVDMLNDNPNDLETRETLAHFYIGNNEWTKAEKEFQKLLNVDSIDIDARFRIANTYFEKSFEDTSYIRLTESMLLKIDSALYNDNTNLILAAYYLREKDTLKFENYFSRVKKFDDRITQIWFSLSGLFYDKKKYNDAIYMVLRGYNQYEEIYQFNFLLGISYQQIENFKDSYEYLMRAYRINDKDIYCLSSLGYCLGKLNRYDESIVFLQKAAEIDNKNLSVISTLATIYDNSGKFEQCDSTYAEALRLFPNEPLLFNNYAYSLAERNLKLQEALEYSKKAIEKDSVNDSYLDTIGWIYFKLGDFANAEKFVRKAVDMGMASAEVLEHMGDIYYKIGNSELAMVYWKKALEKDPSRISSEKRVRDGKV